MEERPVDGYEGVYVVSSLGTVRSLPRPGTRGGTLRPSKDKDGYQRVVLWTGGVGTTFRVHQIVATAFLGPCPAGQEVLHVDGDPSNNAATNLRYGSHSMNVADSVDQGTHHHARKDRCDSGHLFTEANTRLHTTKRGNKIRICRECTRTNQRLRRS